MIDNRGNITFENELTLREKMILGFLRENPRMTLTQMSQRSELPISTTYEILNNLLPRLRFTVELKN